MPARAARDRQIIHIPDLQAEAAEYPEGIENVRLFTELDEKNDALTEAYRQVSGALERETATTEVLRLISKSPGDLELVFRSILENATRICEAKFGMLFRVDGENFRFAAEVGTPPEWAKFERQRGPFTPTALMGRCVRTKQVCRTDDYAAETSPELAIEIEEP